MPLGQIHTNIQPTPVIPYIQVLPPDRLPGFPDRTKEALEAQQYDAAQAALKAEQAQAEELSAQQAQAAPAPAPAPVVGNCGAWLAAAGITDTYSAMILISMESGCNPYAVNPSSGACGVAQELPCGKSGCNLGDGACEVRWMNSYTIQRYGSWANAVAFHYSNGWY